MNENAAVCDWGEASTLMIISPSVDNRNLEDTVIHDSLSPLQDEICVSFFKDRHDYRILMVERSDSSSFLAKSYVFPGGTIEESDFSREWWTIFHKFGFDCHKLDAQINDSIHGHRTQVLVELLIMKSMKNSGQWTKNHLSPSIAFRIAAIRETFEETGIGLFIDCSCDLEESRDDFSSWRGAICDGKLKFFDFCLETNQCPNIWCLYEWWNWLSPASSGHPRFDTMFYICCLENQPKVTLNKREMTSLKWASPSEFIQEHVEDGMFLPPPQIYELSRICNFQNYLCIRNFVKKREQYGCRRWIPVFAMFKDGISILLPGDDLYPSHSDNMRYDQTLDHPLSLEESRSVTMNLNRIELSRAIYTCFCNRELPCGHIAPVLYLQNEKISKPML